MVCVGSRARRLEVLAPAAAAGRALALRGVRDAGRLAARLRREPAAGAAQVAVLGDGLLATELAAALADHREYTYMAQLPCWADARSPYAIALERIF